MISHMGDNDMKTAFRSMEDLPVEDKIRHRKTTDAVLEAIEKLENNTVNPERSTMQRRRDDNTFKP